MIPRTLLRKNPELFRRVSEETHSPAASRPILARLSTVTGWMEPALEDAMGKLACVALLAVPFAELRAGRTGVVKLPGIPTACLLAWVSVRTFGPVMRPPTGASPHFELKNTKMIAGEGIHHRLRVVAGIGSKLVGRQVTLQRREGLADYKGIIITGSGANGIAIEMHSTHWIWRTHARRRVIVRVPLRNLYRRI